MEVVQVGSIADGTPVYMDRFAAEADGVLAINRIKTHTSFEGPIESGLAKMCAVGLGKRQGAETVHRTAVYGLKVQMLPMARVIVEQGRVLGGIAIVEDAREQTAEIVALPPDEIGGAGEARLLARSKELMARLPFYQLDVLVVDELGKNISGTGMDTNIIGRLPIPGEPPMASPVINVIVVLDLTEATHGNANGMGLADITRPASPPRLISTPPTPTCSRRAWWGCARAACRSPCPQATTPSPRPSRSADRPTRPTPAWCGSRTHCCWRSCSSAPRCCPRLRRTLVWSSSGRPSGRGSIDD
jgi:hypothetical protein